MLDIGLWHWISQTYSFADQYTSNPSPYTPTSQWFNRKWRESNTTTSFDIAVQLDIGWGHRVNQIDSIEMQCVSNASLDHRRHFWKTMAFINTSAARTSSHQLNIVLRRFCRIWDGGWWHGIGRIPCLDRQLLWLHPTRAGRQIYKYQRNREQ